jgi:hypothetical protein
VWDYRGCIRRIFVGGIGNDVKHDVIVGRKDPRVVSAVISIK